MYANQQFSVKSLLSLTQETNLERTLERSERGNANVQATYLILSGAFVEGCVEERFAMSLKKPFIISKDKPRFDV